MEMEKIEIDLPEDIIFAMRGAKRPGDIQKKMKMALAILLFQEGAISLGKATELAGISRVKFTEVLKEHGIPTYVYDEKDFERDKQVVAEYRKEVKR